jgi:hypothetical protein
MPIVGYIDDEGAHVPFADVRACKGVFAAPLPFVLSMVRGDDDPHDYAQITASRIASGLVRQAELLRRHEVFVPWKRQFHAWLGRAAHLVAEIESRKLYGDKQVAEVNLTWKHPAGPTIGGRPDSIDYPTALVRADRLDVNDLKITGAFASKMIHTKGLMVEKPEWFRQLNLYRWLTEHADDSPWCGKGLTAGSHLTVNAVYRDWSDDDPCPPIEPFYIPLATDEQVRDWLNAAVMDYLAVVNLQDNALPPCPVEQLWYNARAYRVNRCSRYCSVSGLCNQWKLAGELAEASPSGRFTMDILTAAAEQVGRPIPEERS